MARALPVAGLDEQHHLRRRYVRLLPLRDEAHRKIESPFDVVVGERVEGIGLREQFPGELAAVAERGASAVRYVVQELQVIPQTVVQQVDPRRVAVREVLVEHDGPVRDQAGVELRADALRQLPRLHGVHEQELDGVAIPADLAEIPGVDPDQIRPRLGSPLELVHERVAIPEPALELGTGHCTLHQRLPYEEVVRVDLAARVGGQVRVRPHSLRQRDGRGPEPAAEVDDLAGARVLGPGVVTEVRLLHSGGQAEQGLPGQQAQDATVGVQGHLDLARRRPNPRHGGSSGGIPGRNGTDTGAYHG